MLVLPRIIGDIVLHFASSALSAPVCVCSQGLCQTEKITKISFSLRLLQPVASKVTPMNPLPVPFARRALMRVDSTGPGEHEFTVVTYNMLADYWLQMLAIKKGTEPYSYCPSDYRLASSLRILLAISFSWERYTKLINFAGLL